MLTSASSVRRTRRLPNLGTMCNNPLNIRYSARNRWKGLHPTSPQVAGFCHFTAKVYGYRAALLLLRRYMLHYGLTTPRQMLSRWAPPAENDTDIYVACICGRIGLDPDRPVSFDGPELSLLVASMARQETGAEVNEAQIQEIRETFGL
ncbi:MAG: structural protein P5 [Prevotellaceae bacterium]|nr:structural protein P5 [Prevotellaceae bacterium]